MIGRMEEPKLDPQAPRVYHVLVEGQMHGPFTADSLKAALKTGDVTEEDLVQVGGLPIWRPLRQVLDSPHPRFESELSSEISSSARPLPTGSSVPPPLASSVDSGDEEDDDGFGEDLESSVPDWRAVRSVIQSRLKADFEERSIETGLICLGIGVVVCLASFWPALFWLPWFGLAFFAGFDALRRGKTLQGVGLLIAACVLPMILSTAVSKLRPRPVVESFDLHASASSELALSREGAA